MFSLYIREKERRIEREMGRERWREREREERAKKRERTHTHNLLGVGNKKTIQIKPSYERFQNSLGDCRMVILFLAYTLLLLNGKH